MYAYIIDGLKSPVIPVTDMLREVLTGKSWSTETLTVREASVRPCVGCGGCSERTVGECTVKDDGSEIAAHVARCRLFVLISDVTFGGYSSLAKRALERTLPNILPYFTMFQGELHHKLRYENRPPMLFLGVLPQSDECQESLFSRLAERNGINFMTRNTSLVFTPESDAGEMKSRLERAVEELTEGQS